MDQYLLWVFILTIVEDSILRGRGGLLMLKWMNNEGFPRLSLIKHTSSYFYLCEDFHRLNALPSSLPEP